VVELLVLYVERKAVWLTVRNANPECPVGVVLADGFGKNAGARKV
jgi:hypothetical protein